MSLLSARQTIVDALADPAMSNRTASTVTGLDRKDRENITNARFYGIAVSSGAPLPTQINWHELCRSSSGAPDSDAWLLDAASLYAYGSSGGSAQAAQSSTWSETLAQCSQSLKQHVQTRPVATWKAPSQVGTVLQKTAPEVRAGLDRMKGTTNTTRTAGIGPASSAGLSRRERRAMEHSGISYLRAAHLLQNLANFAERDDVPLRQKNLVKSESNFLQEYSDAAQALDLSEKNIAELLRLQRLGDPDDGTLPDRHTAHFIRERQQLYGGDRSTALDALCLCAVIDDNSAYDDLIRAAKQAFVAHLKGDTGGGWGVPWVPEETLRSQLDTVMESVRERLGSLAQKYELDV